MLKADEREALVRITNGSSSLTVLLGGGVKAEVVRDLERLALIERLQFSGPPSFPPKVQYGLTAEGQARLALVEEGHETIFIRLGHWCSCGFSWNAATQALEGGVSVFECVEVAANQYLPSLDYAWRKNAKDFRRLAKDGKQWYLVEGTRSGSGGDREPLLTQIEFKSVLIESGGSFGSTSTAPSKGPGQDQSHQACGGSPCP